MVRNRNPKQHQQNALYLMTLSDSVSDGVVLCVTRRQYEIIRSLVNFYASWRTQYRKGSMLAEKYIEIDDDTYCSILDTVARIPESEEDMGELMDKLDAMHLSIAQLCDCITSKLSQTLNALAIEKYIQDNDDVPPDPEIPENYVLEIDEERCRKAQALHRAAYNIINSVVLKIATGYSGSQVMGGLIAFLSAAGWFPPSWVLVAIGGAIAVGLGIAFATMENDESAFLDAKNEIVCALYSETDSSKAAQAARLAIDAMGYNAFQRSILMALFSDTMVAGVFSGVIELDESGLDGLYCTVCGVGLKLFSWQAESNTQPVMPATYGAVLGLDNCLNPYADNTSFASVSVPASSKLRITVVCGMGNCTGLSVALGDESIWNRVALLSVSGPKPYWTTISADVDVPANCTRLYIDRGTFSSVWLRYIEIKLI